MRQDHGEIHGGKDEWCSEHTAIADVAWSQSELSEECSSECWAQAIECVCRAISERLILLSYTHNLPTDSLILRPTAVHPISVSETMHWCC